MNIAVCNHCYSSDIYVKAVIHTKTMQIIYDENTTTWCEHCKCYRVIEIIETEKVLLSDGDWVCSLEDFIRDNVESLTNEELYSIYSLKVGDEVTFYGFVGTVHVIKRIE